MLIYAKNDSWQHEQFCDDLQMSTCYVPPLTLTAGKPDTFLETRFLMEGNNLRYRLKNDNETGAINVWRYQHFASHTPYAQKRAVLTGCLQKVHKMASDAQMLERSAHAKLREFKKLAYPTHMLKAACTYMAASHGQKLWLDIRDQC